MLSSLNYAWGCASSARLMWHSNCLFGLKENELIPVCLTLIYLPSISSYWKKDGAQAARLIRYDKTINTAKILKVSIFIEDTFTNQTSQALVVCDYFRIDAVVDVMQAVKGSKTHHQV